MLRTKLAETKRRLDFSHSTFESFMTHVPALAWIVSRDEVIQFGNRNFSQFLRRDQDSIRGCKLDEFETNLHLLSLLRRGN